MEQFTIISYVQELLNVLTIQENADFFPFPIINAFIWD
jgi:hypothetical protein